MKKYIDSVFLGVLAGFFIGLGGLSSIMVKATLDCKTMGGNVVAALAFTIGLCLVCFLGAKLYTGKIAFAIDRGPKEKYIDLGLMLVGNALVAIGLGYACLFLYKDNSTVTGIVSSLVASKTNQVFDSYVGPFQILISSTLCGMMVFLAVFFFQKANSLALKILGIIAPIFIFVLAGFDHVVANMFYFAFGNLSLGAFYHLLIDLLGNSLGAMLLYFLFKKLGIAVKDKAETQK